MKIEPDKLLNNTATRLKPPHNVICFGYLSWSGMWKRNQSMIAQIAKFDFIHKAIFVNPIESIRNISRQHLGSSLGIARHDQNVWVYSPMRFLPFKSKLPLLKGIESSLFYHTIKTMNFGKPYILFINNPIDNLDFMLDRLMKKAALTVIDLSDDFVEYFKNHADPKRLRCIENIKKYVGAADIALAVNDHVRYKYSFLNASIKVVRNATNYENFDRSSYEPVDFLEEIKSSDTPMVGYSGGIGENRLDFELLDYIVDRKKNWKFVFIGKADKAFKERFLKYDNVHLFPPVNYDRLPDCLNYLDLAFVPFKICEHTKGNDLLKFHDYLSMGKPIVSTNIGGANDLRAVIRIAESPSDFIEQMNDAISQPSQEEIFERKNVALNNSWPKRIREIETLFNASL